MDRGSKRIVSSFILICKRVRPERKMPDCIRSGIAKEFLLIVLLALLVASTFVLYYGLVYDTSEVPLSTFPVESIEIFDRSNGSAIRGLVYVATTTQEQVQGFQRVTSFGNCNGLSKNQSEPCLGMIFVTARTQSLCFWMRNTPLPLQQVWISANGTVVYTYQAQPDSLNTICHTSMTVLETSPNISISLGDRILLGAFSHS
jgi:uncharacterized membrane protein (UPF0127 family)